MIDFANCYSRFDSPITTLDCGEKCAPYNESGVPFCCDTRHAIPTAYLHEWLYLSEHTNLWRLYQPANESLATHLLKQLPENQVMIACLGAPFCQRNYRSLVCRSFPFFPYVTLDNQFIGISYYWEYEEQCWIINHLQVISAEYRRQMIDAYDRIFQEYPQEIINFRSFSILQRRVFGRRHRAIPLLHRNGYFYKLTPRTGRLRRHNAMTFPKFGPYKVAGLLPFPGEMVNF